MTTEPTGTTNEGRVDDLDTFLASQPQSVRDAAAEFERGHISASGQQHFGTTESCMTLECTPPAIPVREGQRVWVTGEGIDGRFAVTSCRDGAGVVTLHLSEVGE